MLAKCSRCTQTFQTDRTGEQACPFCGAQVRIDGPAASAIVAPGLGQGGGPEDAGPQDLPAPMDNPAASGGFFGAFIDTWKKSVFDPIPFFGRLTPGPGFGGALGYAVVCALVGSVFIGANTALQLTLQFKTMASDPNLAPFVKRLTDMGATPLIGLFVFQILMAVPGLFINSGILHLGLKLVGGAKGGYDATFRAVAYAQGPILFGVVPLCGASVAGIWVLVLTIIALAKVHRITYGRAIGGYVAVLAGVCCLCGVPAGIGGGLLVTTMIKQARPPSPMPRLPPMGDLPDDGNGTP